MFQNSFSSVVQMNYQSIGFKKLLNASKDYPQSLHGATFNWLFYSKESISYSNFLL